MEGSFRGHGARLDSSKIDACDTTAGRQREHCMEPLSCFKLVISKGGAMLACAAGRSVNSGRIRRVVGEWS